MLDALKTMKILPGTLLISSATGYLGVIVSVQEVGFCNFRPTEREWKYWLLVDGELKLELIPDKLARHTLRAQWVPDE